nr:HAD-IIA family hydrolase [Flexivirga oryzae]
MEVSGDGARRDAPPTLAERFPGLVCDLDGVVYRGAQAVPHAVDSLTAVSRSGGRIVYATNNASRPPAVVAESLRHLGLTVGVDDVLTSSIAGARHLAEDLRPGAQVLAIGGPGVAEALQDAGFRPVSPDAAPEVHVDAVLQGYGSGVTAAQLGEAAYAIQGGARWVATNDDLTLPTDRGVAPGNGSLVAAVRLAVEVDPVVVGKPGALLYELAAQALGTDVEHTLGVGDRLETDVAGAHAAGLSALHVLTGVHGPADLVRARPDLRPRFVAEDLRALGEAYQEPQRVLDGRWTLADASAAASGGGETFRIEFTAENGVPSWIVRLRLALALLWESLDAGALTPDQAVAALPVRG